MSLRIKSIAGLHGLSENAKQQIMEKAPNALKVKRTKSRVFLSGDGFRYCPFPSLDPAVWLHNALVKEFGSIELHEHGEIAHEVIIDRTQKAYRFDHIHIPTRTAIEFDGWKNHHSLASFQRDRSKDKEALLKKFIIFRVTNHEVRHSLDTKIEELKIIISGRERHLDTVKKIGRTYMKVFTAS